MRIRPLKYLSVLLLFGGGWLSLYGSGFWVWALPVIAFGLVPLSEWLLPPDPRNLAEAEAEMVRRDRLYDVMVWLVLPLLAGMTVSFLLRMQQGMPGWDRAGRIVTMGIALGVLGINVAHELGHRSSRAETLMARALLCLCQYMHFYIEHNRGHHRAVSTEEDPASSRRGEMVYAFWMRSIVFSYLSAWKIENARLRKAGLPLLSLRNEMLIYLLAQSLLIGLIGGFAGGIVLLQYLASALIGILLLETVNYIEHYGLRRKKENGRYAPVLPAHSWNSNHVVGRILLFELTRHSDHHYRPGRKYALLRSMDQAPQMPAGYSAMIVLSLIPPLWFAVMHRQIDKFRQEQSAGASLA